MRILALCGLQNLACRLFHDSKCVLYGIGALAASACSGRHGDSMTTEDIQLKRTRKCLPEYAFFWYKDSDTVGRASRLKKEKKKLLEVLAEAQAAHPVQTDRAGIWHRIPLVGKTLIGFSVGLLGVLAALATFLPRISISTNDPADRTDPFSERFTVTNSGVGTLYDVGASVCLVEITAMPLAPPSLKPLALPCLTTIQRP
jgi:hypothetical protein